jgi:hypothetical protein
MSTSFRFLILPFAAALATACDANAVTEEEVVPVYESPCQVFDAGGGACGTADENGSYLEAWSALPCMDVCGALNTTEPHALLACGPVHPAIDGANAGFVVVTCTFDAENYQ